MEDELPAEEKPRIDPVQERLEAQRRIDEAARQGARRGVEQTGEFATQVEIAPPRIDEVLARTQTISNFFKQREATFSALLQDPANQQRYEQNPAGFINAIDQRIWQEISARPEIGMIPPGRGGVTETAREALPWEELIRIRTPYGPREVILPKSKEGKINNMRRVLGLVEESPEPDGGISNRDALHEQALVISALLENANTKAVGEEMYSEFIARLVLHGSYRQFQRADDAGKVLDSVVPLRSEHLNTLFKNIPGVWEAFLEYEKNSNDFLGRSPEKQKEFREGIASKLSEKYKYSEDRGAAGQIEVVPTDKYWAQRIAERLWELTGRRVIRDSLVPSDSGLQQDFQEQRKSGNVRFNSGGVVTAGNFVARRILRAKDYLDSAFKAYRTHHNKLLEGMGFQAKDFFSALPADMERYYKERIRLSPQDAEEATSQLFGDLAKVPKEGKRLVAEGGLAEDQKWPDLIDAPNEGQIAGEIQPIHLEKFQWDKFDFSILGENPLLGWALYNITYADAFRVTLYNNEGTAFSQRPSYEGFKEVIKALAYQGSGQHDTRAKLFENLVKFLRFDNRKEFGGPNLPYAAADSLIDQAGRENVILTEKVEVIKNEALVWAGGLLKGTPFNRRVRLLFHYLSFLDALREMLSAGAKGVMRT